MSEALREGQNNVEVVGTVKKIDIETKKSKAGKDIIIGTVIVEVKDGDNVNNIRCKLFSNKYKKDGNPNGLYKGYLTVKNEYNPGDRIRVVGQLTINEYYKKDGSLLSFNEVKGTFFNRLEGEEANAPDKAVATIDMIIENLTSEVDAENLPTGNLTVDAFCIGYNGLIIPLKNLIIKEGLVEPFQNMYFPGNTGRITVKINNYATVVTEVREETEQQGFGSTERVEDNVVTDYTSDLEIIGGDLPYSDGVNDYTPEQIEQAHRNRKLVLASLKENATAPETPTGFGNNNLSEDTKEQIDKLDEMFNGDSDDIPSF